MAFGDLINATAATGNGNAPSVTPSFVPTAGSLLLAAGGGDKAHSFVAPPSGWATLLATRSLTGSNLAVFWRISDGTETGPITMGMGTSLLWQFSVLEFEGPWDTAQPAATAVTADNVQTKRFSIGPTGSFPPTPHLALAMITVDSMSSIADWVTFSGGFGIIHDVRTGINPGCPPLIIGSRIVEDGSPQSTDVAYEQIADERVGYIAVFAPAAATEEPDATTLTAEGFSTQAAGLGPVTLAQAHGLVGTSLQAGAAALGQPVLSGRASLTAEDLGTGAAALGAPQVGQRHAAAATPLAGGAASLGPVQLSQRHELAAAGLATTGAGLGQPAVTVGGGLLAASLGAGPASLGPVPLGQRHLVTALGLGTVGASLGQPSLAGSTDLRAEGLAGGPVSLGAALMGQRHALAALELLAGPAGIGLAELRSGTYDWEALIAARGLATFVADARAVLMSGDARAIPMTADARPLVMTLEMQR
ncbi:hypothetical protein [Cereibacter azotoformans]|uniref:hypothetical protein n=1 Tax=Cereibacter azotoformans TaxID=43057 RepID=UPI000C6EB694|nr:hypothetical protein [Cereibacter azotoformans]